MDSWMLKRASMFGRRAVSNGLHLCVQLLWPCFLAGSIMAAEPAAKAFQPSDLLGAWQLTMIIIDKNANNRIDEDERKDPMLEVKDFLKFNADGTCEFYTIKAPCRYDIKTSSSGTQTLVLYDKDNTKHSRGRIHALGKDELVLNSHFSGSTFFIWKRL